jgi:hypothetical protein
MRISRESGEFANALNTLKTSVFGNTNIVLHRTSIVTKRPPFDCLNDPDKCAEFDTGVLKLLEESSYRVITVVIDKKEHKGRYRVWQAYPYHYCLMALMERYVLWLQGAGTCGDVMAESRGEKDNRKLQESYERLYAKGTEYVGYKLFQQSLSTKELKIKDKRANVPGLQLADLIANPSMWFLISEKTGHAHECYIRIAGGRNLEAQQVPQEVQRANRGDRNKVVALKNYRPSTGGRATNRSSSVHHGLVI